jgi:hypothetical protein
VTEQTESGSDEEFVMAPEPPLDINLLAEITLRVRVSVGGPRRWSCLRNKRGNIVRSVRPGEELVLFHWAHDVYGYSYINELSCN